MVIKIETDVHPIANKPVQDASDLGGIEEIRLECGNCNKVSYLPVPKEYHDWKKEAEEYKEMLIEMRAQLNSMLQEMERLTGETPVQTRFRREIRNFRDEFFDDIDEGDFDGSEEDESDE